MIDLGDRYVEPDDRRLVTDPLDHKHKQIYDSKPNPFQTLDHRQRGTSASLRGRSK